MGRPAHPDRADEVLDCAVAFLAEHGLAGLSMRKLAAYLGVSTNTISYQFGSKDGLIDAALSRARASTLDMLTELRDEHPALTVAEALRALWSWWREKPERFAFPRLNMEAMLTADTAAISETRRRDLQAYWTDYFATWLVSEGRDRHEAELMASLMLAALTGLIVDFLSTGDAERIDATVELLAASLTS
ncbi:TetR/AcrR family transcriptional regulator [Pseudonocardia sp. C8]|uniref:TetR/AcrR family transcriptional regulator n=1 Tax=Pseudonocardia sp. C8 TaxID=2762759 RepID=UPI001642B269|nr:TetR/AcrR family transcriptional regulator [Pseudonocardia sp. C8]MBC3192372.1 TetR/AcrR family transcriptional regulator [Pseudonocardia sp. C8]